MRYSFTINQKAIIDNDLKIDVIDAILLYCLHNMQLSGKAPMFSIENDIYYMFYYKDISNELPLLNLKSDSVYRRIKKMVEYGLIDRLKYNNNVFYRLNRKASKIL